MKEILHRQNPLTFSHNVSPASVLDVSAGNCQIALMDESGMIKNHMSTHHVINGRSARVALCAYTMKVKK
jgi:hypothetical protein